MAVKARLGTKSLLTSRNFNDQSKALVDYRGLITPLSIDAYTEDEVSISSAYLSGVYSIIYIDAAVINYDPTQSLLITEPEGIPMGTSRFLVFEDEPGTTREEKIETFNDDTKLDIIPEGSVAVVGFSSAGTYDAFNPRLTPAGILFNKIPGATSGGIKINRATDISRYTSLQFDLTLPLSYAPLVESVSIIVHSTDGFTVAEHSFVQSAYEFNRYTANFIDFTPGSDSHEFSGAESIDVMVNTYDQGDLIEDVFLSGIYGVLESRESRQSTDKFKIFVTDDPEDGIHIAEYFEGVWESSIAVDVPGLSESISTHILDEYRHLPDGLQEAFHASGITSSDPMITTQSSDDVSMDSIALSRASIRAKISSTMNHSREIPTLRNREVLFSDSITRGPSRLNMHGSEGYIDSTMSSASYVPGYYCGGAIASTVVTKRIIDTPFNAKTIMVEAAMIGSPTTGGVTYNAYIMDNAEFPAEHQVLTNAVLGDEYDISPSFAGIQGTKLRLQFNIPAISASEGYTTIQNNRLTGPGATMPLSGGGTTIAAYDESTQIMPNRNQQSWITAASPSEKITATHTHSCGSGYGLRFFSKSSNRGSKYSLNGDSWRISPGPASSSGRSISTESDRYYLIDAYSMVSVDDRTQSSITLPSPPSPDGTDVSVGVLELADITAVSGLETYSYVSGHGSWSTFSPAGGTDSSASAMTSPESIVVNKFGGIISAAASGASVTSSFKFDAWTSLQDLPNPTSSPFFGVTGKATSLIIAGTDLTNDLSSAVEYSKIEGIKFYAFGLKIGFGRITGDAYHVGYWQASDFPGFVQCTDDQTEISGFWTDNNGLIFGSVGTYWDYYSIWAPDSFAKTYDASTFDERWQQGFWVKDDGTVGSDGNQGSLWDVIPGIGQWVSDDHPDFEYSTYVEKDSSGYWTADDGTIDGEVANSNWDIYS